MRRVIDSAEEKDCPVCGTYMVKATYGSNDGWWVCGGCPWRQPWKAHIREEGKARLDAVDGRGAD